MSQVRRVAACAGAVAMLAATGAVAVVGRASSTGSRSTTGSNAQRFLALTDASRSGATTVTAAKSPSKGGPKPAALGKRPDCGTGPATPAGWCLTPAGKQYDVLRFPIGLTVDPASGEAIVSSDGGGTQAIAVVNPDAPDPRAAVTFAPGANLFLGLSLSNSGTLYASGGNADRVFRYRLGGPVAIPEDLTQAIEVPTHNATNAFQARAATSPQAAPVGDGVHVAGYPGESVVDDAHHLVFVGGTLSEPTGQGLEQCPSMPGQAPVPACARVSVIDTTKENTGADPVVRRIAVGADTYGLALDAQHNQLFVANWGDQASRGHGTGTVSVLKLDRVTGLPDSESTVIPVGHHPEALTLTPDGKVVYVTDTNDDTVTAISTVTRMVVGRLDVGVAGHRIGTQPDALAVAPDGTKLFVALAGINAVEVINLDSGSGLPPKAPTKDEPVSYLPTGWYPSALAAVKEPGGGTRLWVANAKGIGFGPGANGSVLMEGTTTGGTVSQIDLPADPAPMLRAATKKVIANAGLDENLDPCDPALHPSPVLCPPSDQTSPIHHVVYMVVENKTFDSYFGDINSGSTKGYDASPGLVLFGQPVTTNQHAFVTSGVGALGDNFYSDAEVSVTGHSYASGALATDHNEKTWPADYDQGVRGTHGNGDPLRPSVGNPQQSTAIGKVEDALYDPQGGFVFERFLEKGAVDPATKEQAPSHPLSMAIYGEHSTDLVGPAFHAKGGTTDWKAGDIQYFDSCRAQLFVSGRVGGGTTPDTDQTRDCEKRTLDPQFTLSHWESVFASKNVDVMPNFIYMSLPDNHTLGTNLGSPTPQSMVADNDYAIGTIVQALSQSPFWSSTAVVIVQDDTQATGDHVNPLRDTLEVISPWAATTPDHQRASMGSVLRTIEMLFRVRPVGMNDALAAPLHGAFVSSRDQEHSACNETAALGVDGRYAKPCYTAVRPVVPFALNQVGAPGQAASMAMDWSRVDQIDMATLNAIWWATQHHTAYKAPTTHLPSRDGDG